MFEIVPNKILLPHRMGLRLEDRTRGIIAGYGILSSENIAVARLERKPRELIVQNLKPLAAAPWTKHWKVVVKARESGETLWVRPFLVLREAVETYRRLVPWARWWVWEDGELVYELATVITYNSSNTDSSLDWIQGGNRCPSNVKTTDLLCIAGGGSGGVEQTSVGSSGAGAGGLLEQTGRSVTGGTAYTITVGTGGPQITTNVTVGTAGNDSVFDNSTAKGGGGGCVYNSANASPAGGSSGGARPYDGLAAPVHTQANSNGATGYGNDGGASVATARGGCGGGGAGAVGTADAYTGTDGSPGYAGGNGRANSISGSSVIYAGGGGGGTYFAPGNSNYAPGSGGTGGGGTGGRAGSSQVATAGTDGLGGGGGGGCADDTASMPAFKYSGKGGNGRIVLSFTPSAGNWPNMPLLGM
jgi:hypothetical protein